MSEVNNITELIINFEKRLLDPKIRKSKEELDNLLADEFIEFCSSGYVCNKEETLKELPNCEEFEIKADNFVVKTLSEIILLVTYSTLKVNTETYVLRSSIWKFIDNRWQMIFHQGTKMNK